MAKTKKKKRGGSLGLLQQSFSGWKKLAKYAASGQWANDISRAAHRSGAASRAKERAVGRVLAQSSEEQATYKAKFDKAKQKVNKKHGIKNIKPTAKARTKTPAPGIESDAQRARELTAKMERGEKLTKTELGQAQAIFNQYKDALRRPDAVRKITQQQIDDAAGSLWAAAHGGKVVKPKLDASAAVRKAIAKVPIETTVVAHDRTGTKNGVKSHKKKVTKADHQASVAAEVLRMRQSGHAYSDHLQELESARAKENLVQSELSQKTNGDLYIRKEGDAYFVLSHSLNGYFGCSENLDTAVEQAVAKTKTMRIDQ